MPIEIAAYREQKHGCLGYFQAVDNGALYLLPPFSHTPNRGPSQNIIDDSLKFCEAIAFTLISEVILCPGQAVPKGTGFKEFYHAA